MATSISPNTTEYLAGFVISLGYVGRNRRAITEAATNGNLQAERVLELYYDLLTGDYRPSQIRAFNEEVTTYQRELSRA